MKKEKKLKNKLFIILSTVVCFSIFFVPIARPKAYIVDEYPVEGVLSFYQILLLGENSSVYYDLSNQMPAYLDINETIPCGENIQCINSPVSPIPPLLAGFEFRSSQWTDYDFEFLNETYPYTLTQFESYFYTTAYDEVSNDLLAVEFRYNDFVFMPVTNCYGVTRLELALIDNPSQNLNNYPLLVSIDCTAIYTNTEGERVSLKMEDTQRLSPLVEYVYFDYYPSNALVLDGYPSPILVTDLTVRYNYVITTMGYFKIIPFSYAYTNLDNDIYHNVEFSTVYNLTDYVSLYDSKTIITPGIGDLLLSISQAVVNFLKIEIFPGFAFYYILIIALAIPLLVAILKLYLGG